MTLNIVVQYYADLSFNANFRQSFRRFWMVGYFIATTKSIAASHLRRTLSGIC